MDSLARKWTHAFDTMGSQLIRDDIAAGYAQASGLSSVLLLVAATGMKLNGVNILSPKGQRVYT